MKTYTRGVYKVADNKSAVRFSKFKMANTKWWKIFYQFTVFFFKNWCKSLWKCISRGFWGRWLYICCQIFKIQNDKSNMAEKILINLPFFSKIDANHHENVYLGVFGVADYEFVVRFSKFKMANSKWLQNFDKFNLRFVISNPENPYI